MPVNPELATEQWQRYVYCRDHGHRQFVDKVDRCENFVFGDQWSAEDVAKLRAQRRPYLTINKIMPTLETIMGEQIYNQAEISFLPRAGSPSGTADALTKLMKQTCTANQYNWLRSEVFADGIIRSRGFIDVRLDFTDSMRGEVSYTLMNSKNVVIDPDAEEYDPDKWNDVFITKWLTPQDVAILYNQADAKYLEQSQGSIFMYGYDSVERQRDRFGGPTLNLTTSYYSGQDLQKVRRRIRILERQFRELTTQEHFVDLFTGDMRPVPTSWDRDKIAAVVERYQLAVVKKQVKRIRWRVTADNVVLHDEWSPYKHFTPVPYFPFFRYGRTSGVVERLLGPQELLNKTTSQELHVINTTANSGWKIKAGSLRNMDVEELEARGAQTGLVLELDDIDSAEKITPNGIPTGLDRLSFKAEEYMKGIANVSDSMQGFDREDVAAKAIQAKQVRGSVNFTKALSNLERTDYIIARNTLDLFQEFYTEHRIYNVTGHELGAETETLMVNAPTPEGEIVNDLTIGEFDLIITSVPYRATLEDAQFEQAVQLKELGVPIPNENLIQNSRLMNKSELVKRLQEADQSPETQKARALEERAKAAEVAKTEADALSVSAAAKLSEARASEITGQGPNAEMVKIQQQMELERYKVQEQLKLDREKMMQEFELKRMQTEADIALKRETARMQRAQMLQQQAMKDEAASQSSGSSSVH